MPSAGTGFQGPAVPRSGSRCRDANGLRGEVPDYNGDNNGAYNGAYNGAIRPLSLSALTTMRIRAR